MAFEVSMSYYVCRWCGAPFGVPTEVANNVAVEKRCPAGHRWSDGKRVEDRLRESEQAGDRRTADLIELRAANRNLRGQITKLKKRLATK